MEQRPADMSQFSLVRQHRRMLASMHYFLNEHSRILDFGCGTGGMVYEYQDAGFEAYGFDITTAVDLRNPKDEKNFKFALTGHPPNTPDHTINESFYRIPFEEKFFDFIFSSQVLEHVMDYDLALSQMARVLKPGGVAIHTFPSKYMFLEPHTRIPLGGVLHNYSWNYFWALMGIRNHYQTGYAAKVCAEINTNYAKTGVNYLHVHEILKISKKFFREARLIPHLWEMGDEGSLSLTGSLIHGIPIIKRAFKWMYNHCATVVLFLRK